MMFCGNCGTGLREGMDFCPNCGSRITPENNNNGAERVSPIQSVNPVSPVTTYNGATPDHASGVSRELGWTSINVFAVLGFILSFLVGIPGFVLSIMGYQVGDRTGKNKGLAIAGIVISILNIIFTILMIIAIVDNVNSNNPYYPY